MVSKRCDVVHLKLISSPLTPLVVFQTSTVLKKSLFSGILMKSYLHFYKKKKGLSILIALLLQPHSVNMYKYKNTSLTYSLAGVQYEHGCFSNLFITSLSEQWNHNRQTSCLTTTETDVLLHRQRTDRLITIIYKICISLRKHQCKKGNKTVWGYYIYTVKQAICGETDAWNNTYVR